jgi:hypothetical protein
MNRPCIRGLKEFRKGCPEKHWDGNSGCPAWKEYTVPQEGGKPILIKDCIDCLSEHWQFEAVKLLEGNQQATESFRNGMCQTGPDGKTYPKPNFNPAVLVSMFKELSYRKERAHEAINYDG